jgi:hypothetical protein
MKFLFVGTIQLVAAAEQLLRHISLLTDGGLRAVKQALCADLEWVAYAKLGARVSLGVSVCQGGIIASFWEACMYS